MKRISVLALMFMFLFSCTAFAQKYEYKNDNFNAGHIKNIVLLIFVPNENIKYIQDQYIIPKIEQNIIKSLEDKGLSVTPFSKVVSNINTTYNIDVMSMNRTDPKQAGELLSKYLFNYDAVFTVSILAYGVGSQYEPGFSYNTTQYQTGTVIGSNGNMATITTPQTVNHQVSGRDVSNATAILDFKLNDTKSNATIFAYSEQRTRESDMWNTADPESVAHRVISACINDMAVKIHDDANK